MSKLDSILSTPFDDLLENREAVIYEFSSSIKTEIEENEKNTLKEKEQTKQQIKDLFNELIGEDHKYVEYLPARGKAIEFDKDSVDERNRLKKELRQKVQEL